MTNYCPCLCPRASSLLHSKICTLRACVEPMAVKEFRGLLAQRVSLDRRECRAPLVTKVHQVRLVLRVARVQSVRRVLRDPSVSTVLLDLMVQLERLVILVFPASVVLVVREA